MEKGFEIVDHTADVGIIAYGANMNQAYALQIIIYVIK